MQEYEYEAVDSDGGPAKGRAEAASVTDLVRRLGAEGRTLVAVRETRAAPPSPFRRRLRAQDRIVAFHELATLLESGVSLGDAARAQAAGSVHPELAAGFGSIARALARGESFREALGDSGLALPSYVRRLVEAGELSGRLAPALRQAVARMQYDDRVAAELRAALIYPSILVLSGCAAVLLVFVFVIPRFSNLLDAGNELPLFAEAVLRTGVWLNANGWLLAAALAGTAAALAALSRRRRVRQRARDALATLPFLGDWFAEADTAGWASLMSALLASRVDLLDALGLASRGVRISRRRTTLEHATADVRGGASLSAALEKRGALTPAGYNLVRVGEQSGQLARMLRALADIHEENSRRRMKRCLALVEPLAVLSIGGFLGAVMIGIVLAIASVNDVAF